MHQPLPTTFMSYDSGFGTKPAFISSKDCYQSSPPHLLFPVLYHFHILPVRPMGHHLTCQEPTASARLLGFICDQTGLEKTEVSRLKLVSGSPAAANFRSFSNLNKGSEEKPDKLLPHVQGDTSSCLSVQSTGRADRPKIETQVDEETPVDA